MRHLTSGLAICAAALGLSANAATSASDTCGEGKRPLREIRIVGATLIDPARTVAALRATLPADEHACIDKATIRRLAGQVQQHYADAGIGAVRASTPAEPDTDGVLRIEVAEGRLAEQPEVINAGPFFSEANIRASVPALVPGQPIHIRDLDAQLRIANENPAKETQLVLLPAPDGGDRVQAELRVRAQPLQRFQIGVDNTGTPNTGRHRGAVGWRHANLTDHDDVLSLDMQTSLEHPGRVRVFSAGYRWPAYMHGVVLDAFAAYSSAAGSYATPAGDISLNGIGRIAGLRAGWSLRRFGEFGQRVSLGVDHRHYGNQCSIAGFPEGACGGAGESVSLTPLVLEYAARRSGVLPAAGSARLQRNLDRGQAERFAAVRAGARQDALSLRLAAALLAPFGEDWQLNLKTLGQWSRHPQLPGEAFGAGGAGSVRGYRERELTGDRGVSASVEIGRAGLFTPQTEGRVAAHVYGFADVAVLRNLMGFECQPGRDDCTIASWGVGMRSVLAMWTLSLDVATPVKQTTLTPRNDTRVHFAVSAQWDR